MKRLIAPIRFLVTLGPLGYLPASGTIATVATMLGLWVLRGIISPAFFVIWILPIIALSIVLVQVVLPTFDHDDPPEIVIDEVVGFLFAMSFFPRTWVWLMSGFIVFRFFDIFKPLGIKRLERLGGAAAVVCDDVLAGFYTQIILLLGAVVFDLCCAYLKTV